MPTFWENRKELDKMTDLITAQACRYIGWYEYADGITKENFYRAKITLYGVPVSDEIAQKQGDKYQENMLYALAVEEYEKATDLYSLYHIGIQKLRVGFLEMAGEAFRAFARIILAQDNEKGSK